jgi:hypothetical protein
MKCSLTIADLKNKKYQLKLTQDKVWTAPQNMRAAQKPAWLAGLID